MLGRSALREPVSTMHLSIRYSPFRQVSRGKSPLDDLYGNIYYRYVTFDGLMVSCVTHYAVLMLASGGSSGNSSFLEEIDAAAL